MIYGWLLASLVGVVLGAVIGVSQAARAYVEPMLEFLRPLPASAMMPVAIAILGLTDAMVLAVIAFGALWPMLLATVHGFAAVEPRLYQVSRALGLCRARRDPEDRFAERDARHSGWHAGWTSRSRLFSPSSVKCWQAAQVWGKRFFLPRALSNQRIFTQASSCWD